MKMLEQEEQKYQTLRRQLYEDMSNGIVSKDEYKEFSRSFNEKVENIRKAKAEMNRQLDSLNNLDLKQPKGESIMTVTSNSLKFNKATAVELNYAPYIKVLLNAKTRQIAIQPCSEKDPNAIKFSNEESKQTYAISIKVPAIQVEFRRMLPFEDDNGGKLSYTLNGTLYPDEQVVIYDIGDVKPETEKKRRGRRKKSEIEAEQKEN